jgi:hypothetical protein
MNINELSGGHKWASYLKAISVWSHSGGWCGEKRIKKGGGAVGRDEELTGRGRGRGWEGDEDYDMKGSSCRIRTGGSNVFHLAQPYSGGQSGVASRCFMRWRMFQMYLSTMELRDVLHIIDAKWAVEGAMRWSYMTMIYIEDKIPYDVLPPFHNY